MSYAEIVCRNTAKKAKSATTTDGSDREVGQRVACTRNFVAEVFLEEMERRKRKEEDEEDLRQALSQGNHEWLLLQTAFRTLIEGMHMTDRLSGLCANAGAETTPRRIWNEGGVLLPRNRVSSIDPFSQLEPVWATKPARSSARTSVSVSKRSSSIESADDPVFQTAEHRQPAGRILP